MKLVNWHVIIEGYTSTASISYDGMTSHRDVLTRRCVMLAAALENSIEDLFDTNNPN